MCWFILLQMTSPESTMKSPLDLRPADLVSRLLAATPPYLYTMPLSNSFFFSEMLRSFVQARACPTGGLRRGRKRAWRETRPLQNDKPLELTTNPKPPPSPPPKTESPPKEAPQNLMLPPCNLLPLPSSDSILPPPTAPLWYPPMNMYPPPPPQCFDPHYFVDLRVSGHIWDRKVEKEAPLEPLNLQTEDKKNALNLSFRKHNSAFSVPQPREQPQERYSQKSPVGTNYVLQNLEKIYKDVHIKQDTEKDKESGNDKEEEELTPEEKKVRDLRALIGLELVVDYVKQEDTPGDKEAGDNASETSDSNEEPLVMD